MNVNFLKQPVCRFNFTIFNSNILFTLATSYIRMYVNVRKCKRMLCSPFGYSSSARRRRQRTQRMRTIRKTERCSAIYGSNSTSQMRLVESRIEQIASYSVDFGLKSARRTGSERSAATNESIGTNGDHEGEAAPNGTGAGAERKRRESVFQRGLRKSISIVRGDGLRSRPSSQAASAGSSAAGLSPGAGAVAPDVEPAMKLSTTATPNSSNSISTAPVNACPPSLSPLGAVTSLCGAPATSPVSPRMQRDSGAFQSVGRHNGPSLFDVAHTLAIQREFAEEILQTKVALEKRKRQNREVTKFEEFAFGN